MIKKLSKIKIMLLAATLLSASCITDKKDQVQIDVNNRLDYSVAKVKESVKDLNVEQGFPRNVKRGEYKWSTSGFGGWTSGFFPGLLWYLYEYSGDQQLLAAAESYTNGLKRVKELDWNTHDLGFMMYNSAGNGYRITGNEDYKEWLLQTADSLAVLYNPAVGTILSWPWMKRKRDWPHNTIIDNMLNLELLFWASKNGGRQELYNIAVSHARTTLTNHFREDFSTWHVLVYDDSTSTVLQKITDQGFADESVWSRGQAWAIYGFAMCYRETGITEFRDAAIRASDYYISHLPEDHIPYWDFLLPSLEGEPKDASAAAIAASGFVELATLLDDDELKTKYRDVAINTLNTLSSEEYLSRTMAILDHSTGSKPHNSEIDVPLVYADYYYIEALLRLWKEDRK